MAAFDAAMMSSARSLHYPGAPEIPHQALDQFGDGSRSLLDLVFLKGRGRCRLASVIDRKNLLIYICFKICVS
jgi:hypothetical protein